MADYFQDYYKILQVHHEASREVIQAAYKRLSKRYHPDGASFDSGKMALLNEAFDTLGNPDKRNTYHKLWLEHFTKRSEYIRKEEAEFAPVFPSPASAEESLQNFFLALKLKHYEQAYLLLTEEDRENVTYEDFIEWRNAINLCYEMTDFSMQFVQTLSNCRIGMITYVEVAEFSVTVTDTDILTLESSTDTVKKYVAFDGVSYKVCLMIESLRASTLQYRLLAGKRGNLDPVALYHHAIASKDAMTGLYSEEGFFEEAQKEVIRHLRYGNPFSILALRVHCANPAKESYCLCQCAGLIRKSLRMTDLAARFYPATIVCLLAETPLASAEQAKNRMLEVITKNQTETYHVSACVLEYSRQYELPDLIEEACRLL